MIVSYWVIYHPDLGKKDRLDKPLNYFAQMTGIGPAFGGTVENTPRFESSLEAAQVARRWSMMVLWETEHVAEVSGDDKTFPTCGWVKHYANLEIEASFNRAARGEIERASNETVANIRAMGKMGEYLMGGPEKGDQHEASQEEDRERAEVREPEPGQGVQLDARGSVSEEVEETRGPSGEEGGSDRPEVQRQEAVPRAEGGDGRGVAPELVGWRYAEEVAVDDGNTITRIAVDTEKEHTQDPDSDWPRVGGDCVCDQCGKTYYQHPLDGPPGWQGEKFLNRLCDGRLVKL